MHCWGGDIAGARARVGIGVVDPAEPLVWRLYCYPHPDSAD